MQSSVTKLMRASRSARAHAAPNCRSRSAIIVRLIIAAARGPARPSSLLPGSAHPPRSGPRLSPTARRGLNEISAADGRTLVGARRYADHRLEHAGEVALVREAELGRQRRQVGAGPQTALRKLDA